MHVVRVWSQILQFIKRPGVQRRVLGDAQQVTTMLTLWTPPIIPKLSGGFLEGSLIATDTGRYSVQFWKNYPALLNRRISWNLNSASRVCFWCSHHRKKMNKLVDMCLWANRQQIRCVVRTEMCLLFLCSRRRLLKPRTHLYTVNLH